MIVLDTNIISETMRPEPNQTVVTWLDQQHPQTLFLTTITVGEIRAGIACLPTGKRRERLSGLFETDILAAFAGRILGFDEPASKSFARIRASMRAAGKSITDFDALIASIADTHGFTVATRDAAPFEYAGLPVINPFET